MTIEYELAVKTGSYTDRNGNEKTRWQNVGHLHTHEGRRYITLSRTFNPAGVPARTEGDDRVFISCFEPKAKEDAPAQKPATGGKPFNDDIPF
jgi:hypothetical protein